MLVKTADLNTSLPTVMHLDLNSCFATIEQQAYPNLRGKPLVIAVYTTPGGCILAPSIEAKKLGIKTGMRVKEARAICPWIIVRDPDPVMVRHVHQIFYRVLQNYSASVTPKSIDELVVDFDGTIHRETAGLITTANQIKTQIKKEIGEWVRCSVGISTNRFLSKLAASLHKPDGLEVITSQNLFSVYQKLALTDLNGINTRLEARLNSAGIFTPLEFLGASSAFLEERVFHSVCGRHWHQRLRGWEIDAVNFKRQSFGQSYALPSPTAEIKILARLLMKLCEKMGRRLRRAGFSARGVRLACRYVNGTFWHQSKTFRTALFTTADFFTKALWLLNGREESRQKVREIAVACFHLESASSGQLELFSLPDSRKRKAQQAVDKVNDRWGEYIITPALMLNMKDVIISRVAFGSPA